MSMVFILPNRGIGPVDIQNRLKNVNLDNIKWDSSHYYNVFIPK